MMNDIKSMPIEHKKRIARSAYIIQKKNLSQISRDLDIPQSSLRDWSKNEGWTRERDIAHRKMDAELLEHDIDTEITYKKYIINKMDSVIERALNDLDDSDKPLSPNQIDTLVRLREFVKTGFSNRSASVNITIDKPIEDMDEKELAKLKRKVKESGGEL